VKKPHNRLIPVLTFLKYRYYTSPGIENSIPNWKHYYQWGNETYHSINHAVFKGDVNYVSTSAADIRTIWPHRKQQHKKSVKLTSPSALLPMTLAFSRNFPCSLCSSKITTSVLESYTSCSLKIDAKNIFLCLKTSLPNLARIENN
jgi:hypothetical protein